MTARGDRAVALALALGTVVALGLTERPVGFVRDEGIYFSAGSSYAAWFGDVFEALRQGRPGEAFRDEAIRRRFAVNAEHPALAKILFGLSHALFSEKLGWLRDAAGYRLPAWAFGGLLSALLYLMASRLVSRRGGLFAVAAFWLVPRTFFDGHLACFDLPIAAAWLLVVYCYWRATEQAPRSDTASGFSEVAPHGVAPSSPEPEARSAETFFRWSLLTGLAFGAALAVKHNAWIIPGVLLIHFVLAEAPRAWREGGMRALARAGTPFAAMATLGPLVFYLHWPYLWHRPLERVLWYVRFHQQHINYPWEYFGKLLVEAPFPVGYAFGLTAVTVPAALLLLMATGSLREIVRFAASWIGRPASRLASPIDSASLLVLGNAFASLVVLSMPHVPVFGGTKHWLPSMPFLALLAARSLERIAGTVEARWPSLRRAAWPAAAALALVPAAIGVARNHPYGTSFYNEFAGGYPGGASLGMHRQFWSNNVTGVLPWLNENAPRGARIFFHEVTYDAFRAYQQGGMLRADLEYAYGPADSVLAAYQYMPEFRDVELQIWQHYGTQQPVFGLYLEETPQVVVYRRDGSR